MASSLLSYCLSFPTNCLDNHNRQFPNLLHNRLSLLRSTPSISRRLILVASSKEGESENVPQQYNMGFVWFLGYITPLSLVYLISFIFGSSLWKFVYQLSISKKVLLQSLLPGILDAEMAFVIVLIAAFQSGFRAIAEDYIRIW